MSEIERYKFFDSGEDGDCAHMCSCTDGEYVEFTDHVSAMAELEKRLMREVVISTTLRAQVAVAERLRQAGASGWVGNPLMIEAADEIERFQRAIEDALSVASGSRPAIHNRGEYICSVLRAALRGEKP